MKTAGVRLRFFFPRPTRPIAAVLLAMILPLICATCRKPAPEISLSLEEREWLRIRQGNIRLGAEYIYDLYNVDNEGIYNGVASDYVKLLEEKLNFKFQIVRIDDWFEESRKVASREVDVLNSLAGTTRFSADMLFTPPYFQFPAYVVTRNEPRAADKPDLGKGKTILHLENDDLKKFLTERFEDARIRTVADPIQGLKDVSEERGDALILSMVMATFYLKKTGIANLCIAGPLGYMFKSSIASRSDWPILNRILSKGLAMISPSEKEAILRKWGLKKYFWNTARFRSTSLAVLFFVLLIISAVLLWNRTLRNKVRLQTAEIRKELEERTAAQNALRISENRYQLLADAAFEAILLLENGKIIDINPQAGRMLGYERRELLTARFLDLVSTLDRGIVGGYLESENESPFEFRLARKQGSEIIVESRMKRLGGGDRRSRIMAIRDITERIRSEQEAQRHQEQLFQADKMISLGILVSGMAHEINNPNNSIALDAALLKDVWKGLSPILNEYYRANPDLTIGGFEYEELEKVTPLLLDSLIKNSQRIQHLVDSLKDYSRQEAIAEKSALDINQAVEEGIQLLKGLIDKHSRRFQVHYGKEMPLMTGSKQKIEQVVVNLIQNACLALPHPDRGLFVATRYDEEKKRIRLVVRDEGRGIAGKDLKYIQEPFFTTRRADGGVGLGLFITNKIVEDHQGTLEFDSTEGQGTTVTVSFPAADHDRSSGESLS